MQGAGRITTLRFAVMSPLSRQPSALYSGGVSWVDMSPTLAPDPTWPRTTCDWCSPRPRVEGAAQPASPGSACLAPAMMPFPASLSLQGSWFRTTLGSVGHKAQALSIRAASLGPGLRLPRHYWVC